MIRTQSILILAVLVIAGRLTATERPIRFQCRGLEAYDIQGRHDVDWAWGEFRSKDGEVVVAFSVGPMVEELVPEDRPAGFRTFKVEHLRGVDLRHGYFVKNRRYQATIIGAPMNHLINLIAQPKNREQLLVIARALVDSPCRVTISDSPSN